MATAHNCLFNKHQLENAEKFVSTSQTKEANTEICKIFPTKTKKGVFNVRRNIYNIYNERSQNQTSQTRN